VTDCGLSCRKDQKAVPPHAFFATRDFMNIVKPLPKLLDKRSLMSGFTLVAVLVAWSLIGLGVAYLFGRFIHGAEILLVTPAISHRPC